MYDGNHTGTIVMNLVWVCFNLVILGVATCVAWESRQRRQTVRLAMAVPADVHLPNGSIIHGVTIDISSGGLMIRMERDFIASPGDAVKFTLPVLDGNATLPATIVGISGNTCAPSSIHSPCRRKKPSPWCSTPAPTPGLDGGRPAKPTGPSPASAGSSNSPSAASSRLCES